MKHWIVLQVVAVAVALSSSAHADDAQQGGAPSSGTPSTAAGFNTQLGQPTDAAALEHLSKGNGFYKIGEFEQAIAEYKAGSLIEAAGVFQYNLGQAYRQQGNYERAIWHYERFLAMRQPTGQLRTVVEDFVATMKAASQAQPVDPGPMSGDVAPQQPEPPRHEGSRLTTRRKIAIGVAAVGLVSIGGGVVFGLRANGNKDDAEELCPTDVCEHADEANALLEKGQDNATYANIAFGIGAAAIVGAAVLWFTGSADSPDQTTAITPHVSPTFAGLGVTTRF